MSLKGWIYVMWNNDIVKRGAQIVKYTYVRFLILHWVALLIILVFSFFSCKLLKNIAMHGAYLCKFSG